MRIQKNYFDSDDTETISFLILSMRSAIISTSINKKELFTPGFICVLHTFGRDLKWNPHIHCLISEGGLGESGLWRRKDHFPFKFLRDAFQTALLNEMQSRLGPSFKKVKAAIYKHHENG